MTMLTCVKVVNADVDLCEGFNADDSLCEGC